MKTQTRKKNKIKRYELSNMLIQAVPKLNRPKYFTDYFGKVNYATNERVLTKIREITLAKPNEEIFMTVTSPGGPSGTGMSFFDHIRYVLKPNLVTIGSGDVDSQECLSFCQAISVMSQNTPQAYCISPGAFLRKARALQQTIWRQCSKKIASRTATMPKWLQATLMEN